MGRNPATLYFPLSFAKITLNIESLFKQGVNNTMRETKHSKGQEISLTHSGGLNENSFYWLIYLSVWFPISRTVWEELGGVALLKWVCH